MWTGGAGFGGVGLMPVLVTLLRGVNVSGARPLRMAALTAIYEKLGFREVRTYLQSGNAVCRVPAGSPARHASAIERALAKACGFDVPVAALTGEALAAVVASNPLLRSGSADPAFLHATFLMGPAVATLMDRAGLPLGPGEDAVQVGNIMYLYCPNGYVTTKINNAYFERKLKVRATTRNWRTVLALKQMALVGPLSL
jgi:uncharacterized protein (DUF1697 family)